jgi:hypothetical protein
LAAIGRAALKQDGWSARLIAPLLPAPSVSIVFPAEQKRRAKRGQKRPAPYIHLSPLTGTQKYCAMQSKSMGTHSNAAHNQFILA